MFAAPILLYVGMSAGGCSVSQEPHTPWKKTYSPSPRSHQPFIAPQLLMRAYGPLSHSCKNVSRLSWAGILQSTTATVSLPVQRSCPVTGFPKSDLTVLLPSLKHWGSHLCLRNPQITLYTFTKCVFLSYSLSTAQGNFSDGVRELH